MKKESNPLSTIENQELKQIEETITNGLKSMLQVGESLKIIKERKLYRDFGTFEKYCETKWGFGRQNAYRIMSAFETHSNLVSIGYKNQLPVTESQYRELNKVQDTDKQVEILDSINRQSPKQPLTAKNIRTVVESLKTTETKNKPVSKNINKDKSTDEPFEDLMDLILYDKEIKLKKTGIEFLNPNDLDINRFLRTLNKMSKEEGVLNISLIVEYQVPSMEHPESTKSTPKVKVPSKKIKKIDKVR